MSKLFIMKLSSGRKYGNQNYAADISKKTWLIVNLNDVVRDAELQAIQYGGN